MMRERNRLRPLQMGVTGQQSVRVAFAKARQRPLERLQFGQEAVGFFPEPQANIESHLVVTRAASVKLCPCGRTAGQFRLDVHVDVLELRPPAELARLGFAADAVEPTGDGAKVGAAEQARFVEHYWTGLRTPHRLPAQ